MSHPSWVRGLKLLYRESDNMSRKSHPSWVRGLKPFNLLLSILRLSVAPFVGAWIETTKVLIHYLGEISRTLRGCVD